MASMSDVAKMANVSTATVSRVLQNPDIVRENTRQKVLEAIQALNYQPNSLARQFRTSQTKRVLVVVPNIENQVFSKMVRGIENVALQNDYQVLLGNTNFDEQTGHHYLDYLKQKQVDGIISLTAKIGKEELIKISAQFPIVLLSDYLVDVDIPTVSIDNISSARKATEHLISLGHSKIAHISGPFNLNLSVDRFKGYKQALAQAGLEVEPNYIQEGEFSLQSGFNMMLKLLAMETPPTAIFAASDEMAMGAIKACRSNELKVPDQIAFVGFDNIRFSSFFEPALTTIEQPTFRMGQTAMDMLMMQINNHQLLKRQWVLNDELIVRDSCGSKM